MPTYKLYYFNARGRAEPARLIMAYGGIAFEDIRLKFEQWKEMKPKTVFGHIPALEVDGKMLYESTAIYRFLAKKAGMAGKDDFESALMDMIAAECNSIYCDLLSVMSCKDEEKKKELKKKFAEETLPKGLSDMERYLEKGSGWIVGDKLSWADLMIFNLTEVTGNQGFPLDAAEYPKIAVLVEKMSLEPKILAHITKRPPTAV